MLVKKFSQEQVAFATLLANQNGYKRVFSPGATLTLTQSGLLAVLLERQHHKAIHLAQRRARRAKMLASFWKTLPPLLMRAQQERSPTILPSR